jgi:cytidylate kinase
MPRLRSFLRMLLDSGFSKSSQPANLILACTLTILPAGSAHHPYPSFSIVSRLAGRDIGTVVFPDAELKLFMVATPEVRAQRRMNEYLAKDPNNSAKHTVDSVKEEILKRDHEDSTRELAPLLKAPDAIELDTTSMTIPQVVEHVERLAKSRIEELAQKHAKDEKSS